MGIKLYRGNCLDVLPTIAAGSVGMVLADLPYGTTACKWDNIIPFEPLWAELHRVTKPNAAMCMFGSEPFSSLVRMSNLKRFKYDWIWRKQRGTGHLNARKQPLRNVEIISVFYDRQSLYFPQGLKPGYYNNGRPSHPKSGALYGKQKKPEATTVTGYPVQLLEFDKVPKPVHPTQKPVALLEYLIKTYTREGDTVLDPTMGSGSTGVACRRLKRNFIGIEMDKAYFEIAKERIINAKLA